MASTRMSDVTPMLQMMNSGDERAAERLIAIVYDELRALAAAKLVHERPGHTLQPTALVHEAWLRLGGEAQPHWQNRGHFFAAAAEAMRRVLIENARRRHAARRGSAAPHVALDGTGLEIAAPVPDEDLIRLHEALDRLAIEDPRKAELVKLRYFVGLSITDAAEVLGIGKRSADREWAYARAWLGNELRQLRE
jgi:RNA polymerase sigma factor (TIGR02999 family)